MALEKESGIVATKQWQSSSSGKTRLRRKIHTLLLLTVSGGALIATPQLARADFVPNPSPPNYLVTGEQTTPYFIFEDNVQITTDDTFSITTSGDAALTVLGNGDVVYNDTNAAGLVTTSVHSALVVRSSGDADSTPGAVTITTNGNLSGGGNGIEAVNEGSGHTRITTTGTVTGTAGNGIDVTNETTAQDLTLNVNTVTGGTTGIRAENKGTGDTRITASGPVNGESAAGIIAINNQNTQHLEINVTQVTGGTDGIQAVNDGSGSTRIEATGPVTGTTDRGIDVVNSPDAQDLTVIAETVTGGTTGISAENKGQGDTAITVTGTVIGEAGDGIAVSNSSSAGNLLLDVASVTGGDNGIAAANSGQGDLRITASEPVIGETGDGIAVSNGSSAGSLLIDVASVTGGDNGIAAANSGQGDLRITAAGPVIGETGDGIAVANNSSTGNLLLDVASVTGGDNGIVAANNSGGDLRITASGTVTGETGDGIVVANSSPSGDLLVDVVSVRGGGSGIIVVNGSGGDLRVTASDTVTGETEDGIVAVNDEDSQNLLIDVASVRGGDSGIIAVHSGQGDLRISALGTVTGETEDGIIAVSGDASGNLLIDVANVSGAGTGITAVHSGQGIASITANGVVEGGTAGIDVWASESQAIEININGTVRNSSQNPAGVAITSSTGVVEINNNNLLTGTVSLGDQGNTFNNDGTWNAAGGTSALGGGANLLDNRAGGTILAANAQGPATTTFTGAGTVIHSGSIVLQNREAGGQTAYTGDVAIFTNGGDGSFQSNGGRLLLDTDLENGTSDRLVVDNVSVASGPTRVHINVVGGGAPLTAEGINVVEVLGTSADDAFVLGNSVGRGLYSYQLGRGLGVQNEQNWYLRESDEIRGEVPMAGALSVLAGRTALATLPAAHDRLREDGDESDSYARRTGARLVSRTVVLLPEVGQPARKGVWGRVFGQSNEFGSSGGTGAGYDASLWGAQAGIDLVASGSSDRNRSYGGVYLGYATSRGDALRNGSRLGNLQVNATSVGGYYTRYHSSGFYWDAVAQYSRLSDARMKYLGDTSKSDGSSYLVSLEAGQQFNRDSKYVAQVQGQLLYQKTSIDELRLADSTRFDVGSQSGVTGRVGVRLSRNPDQGARVLPWVGANLWRTFNQDVRVSSLGDSATTPVGGTTGEVELGLSLAPRNAGGWGAYISGGYQFDVSGSEYSGWKGTVGVRKGW